MKLFPWRFFFPTYVLLGNRPLKQNDLKLQFIIIFHNFMCLLSSVGKLLFKASHEIVVRWLGTVTRRLSWTDAEDDWLSWLSCCGPGLTVGKSDKKYLYRNHTCVLSSQSITVVLERSVPEQILQVKVTRLLTPEPQIPKVNFYVSLVN